MSAQPKKKKYKLALFLLSLGSLVATVAPLAVTVILKRAEYFTAPAQSVKLALGASLALFFIALKALGRIKIPRGVVGFGIVFLLSYLLESILKDLTLLSGMALLGECLDLLLFRSAIKRTKENIAVSKTASATTDATVTGVEELFKKYVGSGRS